MRKPKIIWQNPPVQRTARRPSYFTTEIQIELQKNPGQWAIVVRGLRIQSASTNASRWRYRWPKHEFRVSKGTIYARLKSEETA